MPWGKQPERDSLDGTAGLRQRRQQRKTARVRGFYVDSDSHTETDSDSKESYFSGTPEDEHFP